MRRSPGMIARNFKYATKPEYLSYKIQSICHTRVSVIQDSVNINAQWSIDNDMRINTSKTKEMDICFCKDRAYVEYLPYIDINGNDIERLTQAKGIGVTI